MESKQERKMGMQEIMEEYRKLATPTEAHKMLASWEGSWDIRVKAWMEPDQPPTESRGTVEQRMILGGRFLLEELSTEMMGSPFNGLGITGYDNHTKKYQTSWMDTMGTAILLFEGTASPDGKTITQTSHYDDPIQGPMDFRSVTTVVDDNTLGFEMYSTDKTGKENKMMEMIYTRR